MLKFDKQAQVACRTNGKAVVKLNQVVPTWGGNIELYSEMVPQAVCEEFTMCRFESKFAAEFVALQLIQDWN